MKRGLVFAAAVVGMGISYSPGQAKDCPSGMPTDAWVKCTNAELAADRAKAHKELEEWAAKRRDTYIWGGKLMCPRGLSDVSGLPISNGVMCEFSSRPGSHAVHYVYKDIIEREQVRCLARTDLFYVNDALNTKQELFDQCMNLQLSIR